MTPRTVTVRIGVAVNVRTGAAVAVGFDAGRVRPDDTPADLVGEYASEAVRRAIGAGPVTYAWVEAVVPLPVELVVTGKVVA